MRRCGFQRGSALPFPLQVHRLRLQGFKLFNQDGLTMPTDHPPSSIYASSNTVTRPHHVRILSRKDWDSEACLGDVLVFDIYITVLPRKRPVS